MQKQQENPGKSPLYQQLQELGFQEDFIKRALEITDDIEKASEIALKLADEGPDADLSEYLVTESKTEEKPKDNKVVIGPFSRTKMLFIVNGQLKMGKGKVCAQVGHAVIGAYIQVQEEARYDQEAHKRLSNWEYGGTPKIVVKAETEKEMLEIMKKVKDANINNYLVQDAGHTQIKAGSKTVLAVGPAFPEELDPITQHLKLL